MADNNLQMAQLEMAKRELAKRQQSYATPPTQDFWHTDSTIGGVGGAVANFGKGAINTLSDFGKGLGGAVANTGLGLSKLFFQGAEGIGNLMNNKEGAQLAHNAGQTVQDWQKNISNIPGADTWWGKAGNVAGNLAVLGEGTPFVKAGKEITEGLGQVANLPKLADTGILGKGIAYTAQKVLNALPEAGVGFAYGKTQGQDNGEALGTAATFGVLSGLGEVVGDSWKAFKGNLADNTTKALGMSGKMSASQVAGKIPQSINALRVIKSLAPDITVLDEAGVEKAFVPSKATFYETAQAWTKARDTIYKAYTDLAKQAGDEGASFTPTDLNQATKVLEDAKQNATGAFRTKADSLLNDLHTNFGVDTKGGKMLMKNIPFDQMQSFLEKLNTDINPFSDKAGSKVSSDLSQKIREIMDKKITETTGGGYQKLRNSYRDLKSIEPNLVNQFKRAAKGSTGFGSYIEGYGTLDTVVSALSGNPIGAVKGAGIAGLGALMKYLKDPEVNLQRAFEQLDSKVASPSEIRMFGGATPAEITNPIKDIPNKQGGFAKVPGKIISEMRNFGDQETMGLGDRIKQAIKKAPKEDAQLLKQALISYNSPDGMNPQQVNLLHRYGMKV